MKVRILLLSTTLVAVIAAAGCEQKKSSNPLSPSVAGPIPGVTISTPKLVSPSAGAQIENSAQPVTLQFENASTSGQRPLTYVVEVALDGDFNNKVLSRDGIAPGGNGQTSFKLPDPLAAERTYYWRVKAQDGANTGSFANGVNFSIFTPIVLGAPGLASPVNDAQVQERNPTLVVGNCARSGPVGSIVYEMQVSANEGFSQVVDSMEQAEQPGSTRKAVGVTLNYDTRYYWRARAWETTKNTAGPWSGTATFRSPAAPVVAPPPPSGGGGGGGGGRQGHLTGPLDENLAKNIVYGTSKEFPGLTAVFSSDEAATNAAEELLLRTIWHLQLAGFEAGRQKNPSGAISKDKLTILIGGSWHSYDVYSLGYAGRATVVQFIEVWPPNYVPNSGIAD